MEPVVGKALALWDLVDCQAELVAQRENRVYRIAGADGQMWALRLHRPGYRTEPELVSELDWMRHLSDRGIRVPLPIASRNGHLFETIDENQVDMLTWMEGLPIGKSGKPLDLTHPEKVFGEIGRTMARLHQVSDAWERPQGFQRWNWDLDGLVGTDPVWGRFWENPHLNRDQAKWLEAAREEAHRDLVDIGETPDFGLIHADLVRENILLSGDQVCFIDFDDAGFGHRLFDLATVLLANHNEPEYPKLEQALLSGYRSVRSIDVSALPLFRLLRAFTYVGWIVPRLSEPGAAERCQRFCIRATDLARTYLARAEGSVA